MTLLLVYYWPMLAAALLIGLVTGRSIFRPMLIRSREQLEGNQAVVRRKRRSRKIAFAAGLAATVLWAALWHGPLGASDRFAQRAETAIRVYLDRQELPLVQAHFERRPLTRRIILSGPADDFQHDELVRIVGAAPGVTNVRWDSPPGPSAEVK